MASIGGSSPFIIERKGESRHVFTFSTFRPRTVQSLAVLNGSTCGVSLFYNKGQVWRFKPVRIAGSMDGVGGAGDDSESEDTLQAKIEKSKKVLTRQRDLLQQVFFVIVLVFHRKSWFWIVKAMFFIENVAACGL